ncbi:PHP domain-containing protein [Shimazuella sp. AN120528]|uniref:PHP domain-containing protein n=1 Tax=Shimazuella soli TaxID=1892854 RepID=UPI001F113268|nr:PHP domain-containing protein [Shimazuella soli]MCH5583934.1 PHP domain-containing protein [Shimazuella soli]
MKRADLHSHTIMSDGTQTPTAVVELAAKLGLEAIAITDHDTAGGYQEALIAGQKLGVEIVPAVEMSTVLDGQAIDILAYFIDPNHPTFQGLLDRQRNMRKERNRLVLEKLEQLGISITIDEVESKQESNAEQKNVGRVHIGQILVERGLVGDLNEAFDKYLGTDGEAFVRLNNTSPDEAIQAIKEAGGVAVMAHPGLYHRDDLIPTIVEMGLTGIEVNHPDHTEEDKIRYEAFAEQFNLIPTAGSDYHGVRNGQMHHANLGTCTTPYSTVERLRAAANK